MTKSMLRLRWLVRRIGTLLAIFIKFAAFLPILIFMVWFSYKVDISGLFQGELAPRQVANLLLEGQSVSHYEQMDERQVLKVYAQNLTPEQTPDTLAIGSSRVLQLNQGLAGSDSFFNAGVSGAGLMDVMNIFYLFDRADRLPKTLIFEVDPWLFNGVSYDDLNNRADKELFQEFLQLGLGIDSGYEAESQLESWKALLDPAYFQGNVQHYLSKKSEEASDDGSQSDELFRSLNNQDISQLSYSVKQSDGSIYYPLDFRSWDSEQVLAEALRQAGTMESMHGFSAMDEKCTQLFQQFVSYVQSRGVKVIFLLSPYHPFILKHLANNPDGFEGFFAVEPWLRQYAQEQGIAVYGSYHASRVGIPESLFFDGSHCKDEALRLMFPGVEAALSGEQTAYQIEYAATYGESHPELTLEATVGTTGDCVVIDPEWFAAASEKTGYGTPYAAGFEEESIPADNLAA